MLLLATINVRLFSQSVKRQSINSWGNSTYVDGKSLKQTAGQPSNTAEFKGEKITFRQGFQQIQSHNTVSKTKATESSCQLSLYPNPIVSEALLIVPLKTKSYSIWIYDMLGKVIYSDKNISIEKTTLQSKDFISGEYFVKVLYEDGNSCSIKFIVIQ